MYEILRESIKNTFKKKPIEKDALPERYWKSSRFFSICTFACMISPQLEVLHLGWWTRWDGYKVESLGSVCLLPTQHCDPDAFLAFSSSFTQLHCTWLGSDILCTAFHKLAVYFYFRNRFCILNQCQKAGKWWQSLSLDGEITDDSLFPSSCLSGLSGFAAVNIYCQWMEP